MGGAMVEGMAATGAHAPEPPLEAAPIPTSTSDGMDVDASADDDAVDLAASADDMPSLETAPSTSASSSDGMDDEQPDDGAAAELREAAAAERSPYAPVDLDRLSSWIADNPGAAEHAQELVLPPAHAGGRPAGGRPGRDARRLRGRGRASRCVSRLRSSCAPSQEPVSLCTVSDLLQAVYCATRAGWLRCSVAAIAAAAAPATDAHHASACA